jgi:hypothetical protein
LFAFSFEHCNPVIPYPILFTLLPSIPTLILIPRKQLPNPLFATRQLIFSPAPSPSHQQLRHSWNEETIADVERRQPIAAYRQEPVLKSALDAYTKVSIKSSNRAWAIVEGSFEILRDFCGGIATVFANTALAESDFSILGWEKDKFRLSITDLSLEGVMHCRLHVGRGLPSNLL